MLGGQPEVHRRGWLLLGVFNSLEFRCIKSHHTGEEMIEKYMLQLNTELMIEVSLLGRGGHFKEQRKQWVRKGEGNEVKQTYYFKERGNNC